ncbi:MAG: M6 family metalloprotease domain-containing protein [Nitrospirae bacterium]|nr:M6 family metalloprotease domain-containing protein [Nitrospirota bacterium]
MIQHSPHAHGRKWVHATLVSAVMWSVAGTSDSREYPTGLRERFPPGSSFGRAAHGWVEAVREGRLAPPRESPGRAEVAQPRTMDVPVFLLRYLGETEPWVPSSISSLLFGEQAGSLRAAYREYTYDRLDVRGEVYGWHQLARDRAYYEQHSTDAKGQPCAGLCLEKEGGAGPMVREALQRFDPEVDFGRFDNDGPDGQANSGDDDGIVDSLFLVQNGKGGECGGPYVFSHYFQYAGWFGNAFETNDVSRRPGGGKILVDDYVMQPAISCVGGGMIEVGVFAHEFGHALGLPDLYDTDFSSSGVGVWDLMGRGGFGGDGRSPERPTHLSAWSKVYIGLFEPVTLPRCLAGATLPPAETSPVAYKLAVNAAEYFLVECRRRVGLDALLPGDGLLIWHVDEQVCAARYDDNTVNDDEAHRCVALLEADGRGDLDRPGAAGSAGDPYPGITAATRWTCDTGPSSAAYDGTCAGFYITEIASPTEAGCVVRATKLKEPAPGGRVGGLGSSPEIKMTFTRPLGSDQNWISLFQLAPPADLEATPGAGPAELLLRPRLAEGTTYTLATSAPLKDECGGEADSFSLELDTNPDGGGCGCALVGGPTPRDLGWLPLFAWLAFCFRRRPRSRGSATVLPPPRGAISCAAPQPDS